MRRELTERVQVAGHHGLRRPAPLRGEDGLGVLRLIEGGGLRRGQAHKPPRERLGRPARRAREWSATPRRGRRREAHELRSLERAGLSASEVVQSSGSGCGLPIAPAWRGCRPVFGNRRLDTWGPERSRHFGRERRLVLTVVPASANRPSACSRLRTPLSARGARCGRWSPRPISRHRGLSPTC